MFGISASLGSQKSSSEQHQEQTHVTGSTLTAGNNLTINATGEGNAANSGDIVVQGSQLQAGGDTTLDAARDVLLLGAANTQKTDGSNSSSGGSVGVSLGISGASSGLSIFANANKGQGSEHGDGTSWTETTLDSGGTLSLYSGRDTSLVGAQVSGETVKVEVGRDLLLQSQQDSDNYDAKQQNSSVGGSFSPGSMTGSISINGSQDKLNSNFDSVQEQTGIFAGSGGFDITVGGHTQLDGAVIGSTATADKNTLDTGTLGFSDIDNQADFKVEHQSVGISTGGNIGSQFVGNMANGLLVGANNEGHADSTTHAAVSEGTITVRDTDNQQQNVDDLSRDVEQANNALSPIFDKEKEQNRLKEAQLIGEIGSQVGDVFRTQGQIIATQAANEKMQEVSEADREAAKANWEKANPGQVATAEDINGQVYKTAYDQAFNASGYGTGGKFQQAVQAATAALQGLAGGDIAKAIAGGSAPYLAEVIKQSTGDNEEARLAAHAVVGSVLAHLQGNSALAGGAGALTGEIAADLIMQQLYPGKMVSELSETEKQTISALSTLAAGLAGGLTGDSSADAVAGAQAGKNAVENNSLNPNDFGKGMADIGMSQTSLGASMLQSGASPDEIAAALIKNAQGDMPEGQDAVKGLLIAWGEFFGVPVSALTANGEMTPEKAAEILASGVPTSEAKLVQYVFAKAFLSVTKAVYPEGISFKITQPEHLAKLDGYSQRKGISGTHNADAFYSTVNDKGVKVIGETQSNIKGINEVKYQIPSYDRAGNVIGYKAQVFTKTIYDPKVFTDQKILDLGQQAASSGYKAAIASGQREYTASAGGIQFQVYLDKKTGIVENFFPVTN
ncbi:hemagglutinin repeat-containing protein [Yersinia similis]|uniref:hemagglutinin repeat-containing protein n=3 Tax=Yersinia similis TaxID=367190 RepID=UPI00385099B1